MFQRIEQEGRKEDRWAEVEDIKGNFAGCTCNGRMQRRASLGDRESWTSCQKSSSLLHRRRQARVNQPRVLRRDIATRSPLLTVGGSEPYWALRAETRATNTRLASAVAFARATPCPCQFVQVRTVLQLGV